MKEEQFREWLQAKGYQDKVVQSRVANVRKIEEVYPDLDSRIQDGTISNLLSAFTYNASDRNHNREPLHKIQINGDQYNGTATYKSALILYMTFYNESNGSYESEDHNEGDEANTIPSKSGQLYKVNDFREWMCSVDGKSAGTAASYISNINFINMGWSLKKNDQNVLEAVSQHLDNDDASEAFNLIREMDDILSHLLVAATTSEDDKKRLNDVRSALRKYSQFLEEELEDIPDEEEIEERKSETIFNDKEEVSECLSTSLVYTYPEIEDNFCFRLMTQNRMSNDKEFFYPIGIIRKLFRYGQKNARQAGLNSNDYEWFKNWIKDYVAEVGVVTNEGILPLGQLQRLVINPAKTSVEAVMNCTVMKDTNGKHLTVMTEKGDDPEEIIPMQAKDIRGIHIDHSPTMAKVLSETKGYLPAMKLLSDHIRLIAKIHRINIKPANFGKISKKLFADSERVENDLLPLIPALKEELDLLKNKCELKLMQANYNLAKK